MKKKSFNTNKAKIEKDSGPIVPAVEQASRILIRLAKNQASSMTLTEICAAVNIHKSKGYSLLNTLKQFGFVERNDQTKQYRLGAGLLSLSRAVLDNLDIKELAAPSLRKLAVATGHTAVLGIVSGEQLYIVAKHEGSQNISVNIPIGHRFHITAGAHGKAIVAFMPEDDRAKLLAGKKLLFYGEQKTCSKKKLNDDLALCRKKGYASDTGDLQQGISAVSSPVTGRDGSVAGAVILIGTFQKELIDSFAPSVVEAAKTLSDQL